MTTLATTSSLRDALTPEALTRARRRLLTAHPDPTRANTPTPGSLTDEQLRLLAASDWVPPRIAALRCEHDRIAFVQCKQTYGNEHLRVGTRLRPGLGLRAGQGPARPDLERPSPRSVGLSGLGA